MAAYYKIWCHSPEDQNPLMLHFVIFIFIVCILLHEYN
jgi:hypothetical protein